MAWTPKNGKNAIKNKNGFLILLMSFFPPFLVSTLFYKGVFGFLNLVPERFLKKMLLSLFSKLSHKRMNGNIRRIFPDWSEERIEKLQKKAVEIFLVNAFCDLVFFPRREQQFPPSHIHIPPSFRQAVAENKDAIFVSIHFSDSFLMVGQAFYTNGISPHMVITGVKHPFLREKFIRILASGPDIPIEENSRAGLKKIVALRKKRAPICFYLDQRMRVGDFMPVFFLRRKCTVASLPFKIAVEDKRPLLPFYLKRDVNEKGETIITVEHAPPLFADNNAEDALADLAQRCYDIMGGWIKAHPERWMWLHNIWAK